MKKVSIVIGLYNSQKTIADVIKEVDHVFAGSDRFEYEMILVNDHSPDQVYPLVKGIAQKDKRIKVIHLAKNSGQTNAVIEGYRYATGDYVVEMDDDLQMPAYEILHMINVLEEGDYDVVFAKYREQKESAFRLFGSKVNNKMTEFMVGKPKDIRINSFFVMRKFICEGIVKYSNNYPYLYGIIFALTRNVANVEMEHRARTNGRSNYTLKKLLGLWMNGFLNYSVTPLRVSAYAGGIITCISFIVAILLVISRILFSTQAMGWTSLMITIIFFSGVQLLSIGLLGEYLGRLYISNSGLPRATIRETVNLDMDEKEEPDTDPEKKETDTDPE